jgi:hypothetical protein
VIDDVEGAPAEEEVDPGLADMTDLVSEKLGAGDPVDAEDFVMRHPTWAGSIRRLIPMIQALSALGRLAAPPHQSKR